MVSNGKGPCRVAVVTGANRGIGLEIARQLAKRADIRVVLTARDGGKGRRPRKKLRDEGLGMDHHLLDTELAGSGILVNSICPGWVRTDLGCASAPRTVEQGADTAVWLATLPDDGPSGGFFRDSEQIAW